MRLEPGERSILATFHQFPRAEAARNALAAAGFSTVQLDRFGKGGFDPEDGWYSPLHGLTTSQAGVTWHDSPGQLPDFRQRPLLAAMPESSGMAGDLTAQGHGVLLTAVVPAGRVEAAVDIIRAHGGHC